MDAYEFAEENVKGNITFHLLLMVIDMSKKNDAWHSSKTKESLEWAIKNNIPITIIANSTLKVNPEQEDSRFTRYKVKNENRTKTKKR